MSGSGQTRPFEPLMSDFPPKDSEYDSYLEPAKRRPPKGPTRLPSAAKPLRAASGQRFLFFGEMNKNLISSIVEAPAGSQRHSESRSAPASENIAAVSRRRLQQRSA